MQQLIQNHLQRISREYGIRILFACETGSRGWGFASPDSDYDVRFIYVHPTDRYLSVSEPIDTVSTLFEDQGEVLDFSGWDLRKTLRLLSGSNASPFEWLQSPIIYHEEPGFRDELWRLAESCFRATSVAHHYLGICHNSLKKGITGDEINIKKYFYVLRPLLAAIWAVDRQTIPPMEFRPLLSILENKPELLALIHQLWAQKEAAKEGANTPLIPEIQTFIAFEMDRCRDLAGVIKLKVPDNGAAIDAFFRQTLRYDHR